MKKKYFVLNDTNDDNHMGTVVAKNDAELNEKVKKAIEAHYDCTVTEPIFLSMEKILSKYGLPEEIVVATIEEDEDRVRSVEIRNTWLY